jgi:MSHA pilin protein MshB
MLRIFTMKQARGFTKFEFYIVVSVIGIVALVAVQRYLHLADEVRRLNFETLAKHFTTAVYNYRARWIMAQQYAYTSQLNLDGLVLNFSAQGWPLGVLTSSSSLPPLVEVSINSCLSLWNNFLQNPPAISYAGGDPYGSHRYHLSLSSERSCQFELITKDPRAMYFEYAPLSGAVRLHTPSAAESP